MLLRKCSPRENETRAAALAAIGAFGDGQIGVEIQYAFMLKVVTFPSSVLR